MNELTTRYADSREFLAELQFRRESEPPGPPDKSCASFRQLAGELRLLDAQADAVPWPNRIERAPSVVAYRRFYAIRAGAGAARAWLCGFRELTDRLSGAFPDDVNFQRAFLELQRTHLDDDRPLNCGEVERHVRRMIVTFQVLELPGSPSPERPDEALIQCLLQGLRVTTPMSARECNERRGRAFETLMRIDDDVPGVKRE